MGSMDGYPRPEERRSKQQGFRWKNLSMEPRLLSSPRQNQRENRAGCDAETDEQNNMPD